MRERDTVSSRCRVAIVGFGTVGSAVARRLTVPEPGVPSNIQLTHIVDRRAAEKRALLPADPSTCSGSPRAGSRGDDIVWTTSVDEALQSGADIVVEAIGGVEPAAGWIRAALLAGKSVVTANKQVIARHGQALLTLAARQGRQLRFEAAVGGAMPIVRAIGEGLAGDRITRLTAILNGTTNAVLSQMEATGCALDEAARDARARGYAEADPSADLDGDDARAKLAILCALAFGLRLDPSAIETRSSAAVSAADFASARRRGATIRQIAHAEYDRASAALTAWVAPTEVKYGSIFAQAVGPQNAALIRGTHSGEIGIFGAGAGGEATAVAILGDIRAIARDKAAVVPAPTLSGDFRFRVSDFRLESGELSEAS
jgi:homoserine dehydrogenase